MLRIFKGAFIENNYFGKEENGMINKQQQEWHANEKISCICRDKFLEKYAKDKNYRKVGDHCHYTGKYRGAAHSICNLRFNIPSKTPAVFHNETIYDYHFLIKNYQMSLEKNLIPEQKIMQIQNLFSSNRKVSYRN